MAATPCRTTARGAPWTSTSLPPPLTSRVPRHEHARRFPQQHPFAALSVRSVIHARASRQRKPKNAGGASDSKRLEEVVRRVRRATCESSQVPVAALLSCTLSFVWLFVHRREKGGAGSGGGHGLA